MFALLFFYSRAVLSWRLLRSTGYYVLNSDYIHIRLQLFIFGQEIQPQKQYCTLLQSTGRLCKSLKRKEKEKKSTVGSRYVL